MPSWSITKKNVKEIGYHYVAGGYTINNVALYASALVVFSNWLLTQIHHKDDDAVSIPVKSVIAILALMLLLSSWRSYYRVTNDYYKSSANASPITHAATASCNFWNSFNKTNTTGGAILKAAASSASWFILLNEYSFMAALITTLAFLPACFISQFAFLGQESRAPVVLDATEENPLFRDGYHVSA